NQGEYQQALDEVKGLEKIIEYPDDHLAILSLKSEIFYRMGNLRKALNLTQHLLQESAKQANQLLAADALSLKSTILWRLGQYSESFEAIDKGETILNRMKDTKDPLIVKRAAQFVYRRGTIYLTMGDLKNSYQFATKALEMREEVGDKEDIANSLNNLAGIYAQKGDVDQALTNYKKSLDFFNELKDMEGRGMVLGNLGLIYAFKGELDEALECFEEALIISENFGLKFFYPSNLTWVGYVHMLKGNLNDALEYLHKSARICEEMGIKQDLGINLGILGSVYTSKGELDQALKTLQECQIILDELGITEGQYHAWIYHFLGRVYHVKGMFDTALENYTKGLAIFEALGDDIAIVTVLFNLVKISIELSAHNEAKNYVENIGQIHEKKAYRNIEQMYRVTQALVLKTSDRAIQRAESQKILQQLVLVEPVSLEIAVEVLLNLSDLLLDELKSIGSEEALKEIKNCSNRLLELSKTQSSYYLLAETYLLQSKLALLEFDVQEAQNLLSQAEFIAEEKDLGKLTSKLTKEKDLLSDLIERLDKVIDERPSMSEIIELTQLEDLFEKMLKKRIYRKEEEILEYAVQARTLVQTMGKR
ncbi:MAG: tetratricopeptide repeat protein, partial [Candidatus Hodarchaeota archaeon]